MNYKLLLLSTAMLFSSITMASEEKDDKKANNSARSLPGLKKGFFDTKPTSTNTWQIKNPEPDKETKNVWTDKKFVNWDFVKNIIKSYMSKYHGPENSDYVKKHGDTIFTFDESISFLNHQGHQFLKVLYFVENDVNLNFNIRVDRTDKFPDIYYVLLVMGDKLIKNSLREDLNVFTGNKNCGLINYTIKMKYNNQTISPAYSYYSIYDYQDIKRYVVHNNNKMKKIQYNDIKYSYGSNIFSSMDTYAMNLNLNLNYIPFVESKFIVDDNNGLIKPNGQAIVTLGSIFKDDVTLNSYVEDPYTNLPYVMQIQESEDIQDLSLEMKLLIEMMGGIELLKKHKILFNTHEFDVTNSNKFSSLSPIEARAVLQLSYEILSNLDEDKNTSTSIIQQIANVALEVLVNDALQNEDISNKFQEIVVPYEQIPALPEVKQSIGSERKQIDENKSSHQKKTKKKQARVNNVNKVRQQREAVDKIKKKTP